VEDESVARTSGDKPVSLSQVDARQIWLKAQRLDVRAPFGSGPEAVQAAIEHLGYVQIDTINVIERCHHHILYSRIPEYVRTDLAALQSEQKSIFEYWTHALSYVPSKDFAHFGALMQRYRDERSAWFGSVTPDEIKAMIKRLKAEGPLSIRDIDDDVLVEKTHAWGSKKPSKRVLQLMFYQGLVTISQRQGMVKTYELTGRHFGWEKVPKPSGEKARAAYLLDRALRAQGFVSLAYICHLNARAKAAVSAEIERRVQRKKLVPIALECAEKIAHWIAPEWLDQPSAQREPLVHILSPFDPLIILRRRLASVFDYEHIFEAYVPANKRKYGYFALPVLLGERVVAVIDLKTDRAAQKMRIQNLHWREDLGQSDRQAFEIELGRFERFQLSTA
jgi:uncharacterized protein YcaQ